MALATGSKLGPYEILGPAGAGGMGEVYRARDTRLDRTVAIKVLPEQFSQNPDLKQRLEREARAISSLNHPNICTLYDVGHQDGVDYLVMEYIEGESLAARLMRGPLPAEQVLKTGTEIAEALEKAHKQGIVHRDLKPGNVMLTKSGAKLLDFGLAKPQGAVAAASGLTGALTQTSPVSPITQHGTIVGTFQYMSPEQVEGREADARSDIFALGAVLYEMATGKRAFEGKSAISVASAILEKEPEPISKLQPMTPPALEQVVKGCLAKDPEERFQTAHDVKLQLKWIAEGGSSAVGMPAAKSGRRRQREWLAWGVAGLLVLVTGGLAAGYWSATHQAAPVVRAFVPAPAKWIYAFAGDVAGPPVVSPDGRWIAFVAAAEGRTKLWVRPMDGTEARALDGTDNATFPFWSADSRSLGFFADAKLKVVDAGGGPAVTLADAPAGRGGAWNREGTIVYTPDFRSGLLRIAATGGTPAVVTKPEAPKHTTHRWPQFLPDGQHLLYVAANHEQPHSENDGVYWASLDGKQNRLLLRTHAQAVYAQGYLLFLRENQLMAQPFDPARGRLSGEATRVVDNVQYDAGTWHGVFDASSNGLLIYSGGASQAGAQAEWFDRSGKMLGEVGPRANLNDIRISPQGDRVVVAVSTVTQDLWTYDLRRDVKTRLTFGDANLNGGPVWSPDGSQIAFGSDRGQASGLTAVYTKAANGTGEAQLLLKIDDAVFPTSWSPDGKYLLLNRGFPGARSEVWVLPLSGDKKPYVLARSPSIVTDAMFSPDGRWVAYGSGESGRLEIFLVPFGGSSGKWQVSTDGGAVPRWRHDGKELYYLALDGSMMAVSVSTHGDSVELGRPQALFRAPMNPQAPAYDVTADGKRFLINGVGDQQDTPITVVVNWTAGIKK